MESFSLEIYLPFTRREVLPFLLKCQELLNGTGILLQIQTLNLSGTGRDHN